MNADAWITLGVLAGSTAVAVYGQWRGGRPADPMRPRLIPWTPVVLIAAFAALLALVHLLNLAGLETGRR
jgi:hypothetical protein